MNTVIFKVAAKGEGKTKWLLDIANKFSEKGRPVLLYTDDAHEFEKFCNKYFSLYGEVCPVKRMDASNMSVSAVVLVDNLFNHDSSVADFTYIQRNCYKMFVTVEGVTDDSEIFTTAPMYEQLCFDFGGIPC